VKPRPAYIRPRRDPGHIAELQSFAQHATTMFFPHFVGDARTIWSATYGARRPR
jgi:hypothetical protein